MRTPNNAFTRGLAIGLIVGLTMGGATSVGAAVAKKAWDRFGELFQTGYVVGFNDCVRIAKATDYDGFLSRTFKQPPTAKPRDWIDKVNEIFAEESHSERDVSQVLIIAGHKLEKTHGSELATGTNGLTGIFQMLQSRRAAKREALEAKKALRDEGLLPEDDDSKESAGSEPHDDGAQLRDKPNAAPDDGTPDEASVGEETDADAASSAADNSSAVSDTASASRETEPANPAITTGVVSATGAGLAIALADTAEDEAPTDTVVADGVVAENTDTECADCAGCAESDEDCAEKGCDCEPGSAKKCDGPKCSGTKPETAECDGGRECADSECDKADCPKTKRSKANDPKAECPHEKCKNAECTKADCPHKKCSGEECPDGACPHADCPRADCPHADCSHADCPKAGCDKPDCPKSQGSKADCPHKSECTKSECAKKGECSKGNDRAAAAEGEPTDESAAAACSEGCKAAAAGEVDECPYAKAARIAAEVEALEDNPPADGELAEPEGCTGDCAENDAAEDTDSPEATSGERDANAEPASDTVETDLNGEKATDALEAEATENGGVSDEPESLPEQDGQENDPQDGEAPEDKAADSPDEV